MSLSTALQNLATRAGTEDKKLRTLINGNAADLSALLTTAKTNLVAAINELKGATANAAGINDGTTASSSTWSSTKVQSAIDASANAVKAQLINGAPAALDSFNELVQQMQSDESGAATMLGNLNTLTTNVGDTTVDLVAAFNAALA